MPDTGHDVLPVTRSGPYLHAPGRQRDKAASISCAALRSVLARLVSESMQDGRAFAQLDRDAVIAHAARQALDVEDLVLVGGQIELHDRRDRQAFHASAPRRELGAHVGVGRRQL